MASPHTAPHTAAIGGATPAFAHISMQRLPIKVIHTAYIAKHVAIPAVKPAKQAPK